MPRFRRFCPPGIAVHVIQRGNNRQACFTCDEDMAAYAHWLDEAAKQYGIHVHAWVFMTNHVHLLLTPTEEKAVSPMMQYIGRLYVRRFNYRYNRTGTLFDGRFKSSLVQSGAYVLNCLKYIELNPVRAGMVRDPGDYVWSSYRTHAFGLQTKTWTPHPAYLSLAETNRARQTAYRVEIGESLDNEAIAKIRHCINTGLVLGTEDFRNQVEALQS